MSALDLYNVQLCVPRGQVASADMLWRKSLIVLRLYNELGVGNMDKILYYGAYNFILLYRYREFTENTIENCFIDKITDGSICLLTKLNA